MSRGGGWANKAGREGKVGEMVPPPHFALTTEDNSEIMSVKDKTKTTTTLEFMR